MERDHVFENTELVDFLSDLDRAKTEGRPIPTMDEVKALFPTISESTYPTVMELFKQGHSVMGAIGEIIRQQAEDCKSN